MRSKQNSWTQPPSSLRPSNSQRKVPVSEVAAATQTEVHRYPGVYLQKPKDAAHRWIARVSINGKRIAVPGRHASAQEASDARAAFLAKHAAGAA
jgi:hypothetical protein